MRYLLIYNVYFKALKHLVNVKEIRKEFNYCADFFKINSHIGFGK